MRKILKYILGIVIVAILVFSILYMSSEHEYDLVEIEEVKTDENYIFMECTLNLTNNIMKKLQDMQMKMR